MITRAFEVNHNGITAVVERRSGDDQWRPSWWLLIDQAEFPIGGPEDFADEIAAKVRDVYIGDPPPSDHTKIWGAYTCMGCGATGVRLWRDYQTFLDSQTLRCQACAEVSQGKRMTGWLVPAVPTPDGESFWGYTSVPMTAVAWWKALPSSNLPAFKTSAVSLVRIVAGRNLLPEAVQP